MPANPPPAQLLPVVQACGHCNAPARWVELAWRVKCTRPSCGVEGGKFETRREAIAAWNTRAPSPERGELASLVEALTSAFVTSTCGPGGHYVTLTYPDCKAAGDAHSAILEYRKGVRWSIEQSAKTGAVATDAAGDAS